MTRTDCAQGFDKIRYQAISGVDPQPAGGNVYGLRLVQPMVSGRYPERCQLRPLPIRTGGLIDFIVGFNNPRPCQNMRRPAALWIRFDEGLTNQLSTRKLNNKAEHGTF
jgi:hypothetical protein